MVELLDYLAANGFTNYIASGGGRDFMRPISQELYRIPRERVIGSTAELDYTPDERGGTITHKAAPEYLDDGPQKPIRIWSRTGRRPIVAGGNSNGDIQMLQFTQHPDKPTLRLLILHDDAEREFAYTTGAEQALDQARTDGWTIVSVKNDWSTVFGPTSGDGPKPRRWATCRTAAAGPSRSARTAPIDDEDAEAERQDGDTAEQEPLEPGHLGSGVPETTCETGS